MKHAFLIIAHNEPVVLAELIRCLDDVDNDIFIHWDKKQTFSPHIATRYSRLEWLENRIDVRWGDITQIMSEYVLFETAYRTADYDYFHLISGTHLPLKSQQQIHSFFEKHSGKQFLMPIVQSDTQIDMKMRQYHLFIRSMHIGSLSRQLFFQRLWHLCLIIQNFFGIHRNQSTIFCPASNWLSLTRDAVRYLLEHKKDIMRQYRYSFCGDEFFIPTALANSPLKDTLFFYDKYLKVDMNDANACVYEMKDLDDLLHSDCLFARKFSAQHPDLIKRIIEQTQIDTD